MEINITNLFSPNSSFIPDEISASAAERGENVGQYTWRNALESANTFSFLKTEEEKQEFRDWIKGFGAWEEEEINSWTDQELNALFLQFVAGDVREAFHDEDFDDWDWEDYENRANEGTISGNLFFNNGEVFFNIGV